MFICSVNLFAQQIEKKSQQESYNDVQKTSQEITEIEISKLLAFNLKENILIDSVAIYTFAIYIKGNKIRDNFNISEIKINEPIGFKLFPKIDSLLKNINFSQFVRQKGFNQIIIPVAIILTAHDKMPKNNCIKIWDLPKRLNELLETNNELRYQSIYLKPKTIMVDNQVYH